MFCFVKMKMVQKREKLISTGPVLKSPGAYSKYEYETVKTLKQALQKQDLSMKASSKSAPAFQVGDPLLALLVFLLLLALLLIRVLVVLVLLLLLASLVLLVMLVLQLFLLLLILVLVFPLTAVELEVLLLLQM